MELGKIQIELVPNGPAIIKCETAEITLTDGSIVTKEKRFSLCRCGESKNKPFCDGTHKTCGFEG